MSGRRTRGKQRRPARRDQANRGVRPGSPGASGASAVRGEGTEPPAGEQAAGIAGRLGLHLRSENALALFALCAMVVVAYLPAMLWGDFVWDDEIFTESRAVLDMDGLWRIWFDPSDGLREQHYWPLVYTTFWVEHKLWGLDATGYHVVNVILHGINTVLVLFIAKRLAVPGALVIAAVFALHPVHVESVAWVIERKDVLSGAFYLGAVWAWLRHVEEPHPKRYFLSLAFLVAGMLSKLIVVTLPAALVIVQWWKHGKLTPLDYGRLAPFFLIAIAMAVGDMVFLDAVATAPEFDYTFVDRVFIAAWALWFYLGKLLWPTDLAVIYPFWQPDIGSPITWMYLLAALALPVALWFLRGKIGRGPLAGMVYFAVTLFPVLGFVDHSYMDFSLVADRFQYLASLGPTMVFVGLAVAGMGKLPAAWARPAKAGITGACVVMLTVMGVLSWRQASLYEGSLSFYGHIVSLNPGAVGGYAGYSGALLEEGRLEEALEAARLAVHYYPEDANAHLVVGGALYGMEDVEGALEAAQIAIGYKPKEAKAHGNAGLALYNLGRMEESEAAYLRSLELDPDYGDALSGLSGVRLAQGRHAEMLELLDTLVGYEPENASAHANRGIALHHLGRSTEAIQSFDLALSLDPTMEHVRSNRAQVLQSMEQQ